MDMIVAVVSLMRPPWNPDPTWLVILVLSILVAFIITLFLSLVLTLMLAPMDGTHEDGLRLGRKIRKATFLLHPFITVAVYLFIKWYTSS